MSLARRSLALLLLSTLAAGVAGCGAKSAGALNQETSHVRLLTMLHSRASSKLKRAPRDEQEFKQTIAALPVSMESLKVSSVDDLFVSERDGQPLAVVYGKPPKGSDVLVYEQTGVNGKRLVGHKIGMVEELDEASFAALGIAAK